MKEFFTVTFAKKFDVRRKEICCDVKKFDGFDGFVRISDGFAGNLRLKEIFTVDGFAGNLRFDGRKSSRRRSYF